MLSFSSGSLLSHICSCVSDRLFLAEHRGRESDEVNSDFFTVIHGNENSLCLLSGFVLMSGLGSGCIYTHFVVFFFKKTVDTGVKFKVLRSPRRSETGATFISFAVQIINDKIRWV